MIYATSSVGDPSERIAGALNQWAFWGLCAFVASLSAGGDSSTIAGTSISNWIVLIPLGFTALRAFATQQFRIWSALHVLFLTFVGWATLSLFWTVHVESTVQRMGTLLAMLIFVALLWELTLTRQHVHNLLFSYIVGASLGSLITIQHFLTGRTTSKELGDAWDTKRYSVDGVNADEFALIVALSIPMAMYLLIANRSRLVRSLCWIHVVLGCTAILLTATRGAAIAGTLGIALLAIPTFLRMTWIQRVLVVVACIGFLCSAVYFVPDVSTSRLLNTGTELTQGTLTHRTVLWAAGLEVFRDHPLLGVGAGAYGSATVKLSGLMMIAHNTLISVLVELGVIGAVIFVALLGSLFYSTLRLPAFDRAFWFALLCTWFVGAQSVTWEHRKATWFLFGVLAAHAYAQRRFVLSYAPVESPQMYAVRSA